MSDRTLRHYTKRAEKNVSNWPPAMQRATAGRYLAAKPESAAKKAPRPKGR